MNEQLIKFIELCLVDGVISDKEREVIFRKSKELGVPEDECEILIDSLVSKHSKSSTQPEIPKKKGGFFSSIFNEIKKNVDTESIKSSFNLVKEDLQKGVEITKGNGNPIKDLKIKPSKKSSQKNETDDSEKKNQPQNSPVKPYKVRYSNEEKHEIYKEYLEVIGSKQKHTEVEITITGKKGLFYYTETFNDKDYNKIVDTIKSEFSNRIGCYNQEECLQVMNKKSGFFETPSIWNMILMKKDLLLDTEKIGLGLGNESECVIFQERHVKFYSRVSHNHYLKQGIHCGNDGSWLWSEILDDQVKCYQYGKKGFNDSKIISISSPIILEIIGRFIDLRVDQIKNKVDIKKSKTNKLNSERGSELDKVKNELVDEFDKDKNGVIDLFQGEDEFLLLFRKNQDVIQTKGDEYIKNFIKISNYLNQKQENISKIYDKIVNYTVDTNYGIKKSDYDELREIGYSNDEIKMNLDDLNGFENSVGLLKNQIHLWNLVFLHSTNMIVSLIDDDKITFYDIYEKLDKLNIFNSNWENEVSERLKNIEEGLGDLIYSIHKMENNIISELQNMTYLTNESIKKLDDSVSKSLNEVNRQLSVQTMWSIVNTYQVYKINKNTKSLRG